MITIAEPRYKCTDCSFSTGTVEGVPTCAICNRMMCPNCETYQFTHLSREPLVFRRELEASDSIRYLMQLRLCMPDCWDSIATEVMALVDHRRRSFAELEPIARRGRTE